MLIVVFGIILLETGGICITPRPSEVGAEIIAGMPMRPFFGIEPAIVDSKQVSIAVNSLLIFI